MLQWFRARASLLTGALLMCVGTLAVPHLETDDAACAIVVVPHDAAAHRLQTPESDSDSHPLTCLACQWVRSVRLRTETDTRRYTAPEPQPAGLVPTESFAASSAVTAAQPPLRSPPPILASA